MDTKNAALHIHLSDNGEPGRYKVRISENDILLREAEFSLRFDTPELVRFIVAFESGEMDFTEARLKEIGEMLYQKLFVEGDGDALAERRRKAESTGESMTLFLTIASPKLSGFPWEMMHDGRDFLSIFTNTSIVRRTDKTEERILPLLQPPLRVLAVISNPIDLPESNRLDIEEEEHCIQRAFDPLILKGLVELDFIEEASLGEIREELTRKKYNILHYSGHGTYHPDKDTSYLLMEDKEGKEHLVSPSDLAALLGDQPSMRMVFLSGCHTAHESRVQGFPEFAARLLEHRVPSVLAMRTSVRDDYATEFAEALYGGIANGVPLAAAVAGARKQLLFSAGRDRGDFAIPALYSADPDPLRLDPTAPPPELRPAPPEYLPLPGLDKGFIGRRRELRQIKTELIRNNRTAVMVHGFGGLGKTVLAVKAARKLSNSFPDGIFGYQCSINTNLPQIFHAFNDFLAVCCGNDDFNAACYSGAEPEMKTNVLIQILKRKKILIVFDNFESILNADFNAIADESLRKFFNQLLGSLQTGSKIIITTRYVFDPLEERLTSSIFRLPLGEMDSPDALRLMDRTASLRNESFGMKKAVLAAIGGHPFTIDKFSRVAEGKPVGEVLERLRDINREMMDFTLLLNIYDLLSSSAQRVLIKIWIYKTPVPYEALTHLFEGKNVDLELRELVEKGLLSVRDLDDEKIYSMHTLVRDFAEKKFRKDPGIIKIGVDGEHKSLLIQAADFFYEYCKNKTKDADDLLSARDYYFESGEFERAGELVFYLTEIYVRWGYLNKIKELLNDTIQTTKGNIKAGAIHNVAVIYYSQGEYDYAMNSFQQSLNVMEQIGDKSGIAKSLHQIGMIYQNQGNYEEAMKNYKRSMKIAESLGDKSGIASSLGQIGNVLFLQGNYDSAMNNFQQSLNVMEQIGDKSGIATSLHQIGIIYQYQGNYEEAMKNYERSAKIKESLGDKSGIAITLHQIGMIYQNQGNYEEAMKNYEWSLKIAESLGDKSGIAKSLHQIGIIYQDQGNYEEAMKNYERSVKIKESLGDKSGIAITLHQIGMIYQDQGNCEEAMKNYERSLKIKENLGDKSGIAGSLHQIGTVLFQQGNCEEAMKNYERSLKIAESLGDKSGIANSLHQIGIIYQDQGNYEEAMKNYERSLKIAESLGDKRGIAGSIGQMGKCLFEIGKTKEAINYLMISFNIFNELGSPNKNIVGNMIREIKEEIGEDYFKAIVREIEAESGESGPEENEE